MYWSARSFVWGDHKKCICVIRGSELCSPTEETPVLGAKETYSNAEKKIEVRRHCTERATRFSVRSSTCTASQRACMCTSLMVKYNVSTMWIISHSFSPVNRGKAKDTFGGRAISTLLGVLAVSEVLGALNEHAKTLEYCTRAPFNVNNGQRYRSLGKELHRGSFFRNRGR